MYKETEKCDALEEENTDIKKKLHECEEKYADVSSFNLSSDSKCINIFACIEFNMFKELESKWLS